MDINIRVDVHHHSPADCQLGGITTVLEALKMTIDELKTKVDASVGVQQSAIDLIKGLATQLASIKNDPAKIQALADELDAKAGELAGAVQSNSPPPPA